MHFALCALYVLLSAVLVFFSYKSLRGGINYLDYFKRELAKPPSNFTPFVSIIAPCRGIDDDLEKNLDALFKQDFPAYEIIFAVDSETDAAVEIIEKLISANSRRQVSASLVVAGKAAGEAQKIHNLREAVRRVSAESKVFAFVDSDARPDANWLRVLIAPLVDEKVGCATGYRWFVQKKGGLATHFRSVWNASIASALGANTKSNFCWGGSTAIRRMTFEKLNIRERWRGTLSDDFVVTRAMHEARLAVYFVPQALTASVEDCGWQEFFEFTTRQMKITRVYAAHLWKQSFLGSFLFNLVWIWGIINLVFAPADSFLFWFTLIALFLITGFSAGKSRLRLAAVRLVLKDYESELKSQFLPQNILWILSPVIYLYNCSCAFFSNEICWRGIKYKLKSPHETIILRAEKN